MLSLQGKRGLIVGVANDKSIAYGCAKAIRAQGAELALTYLNAKAEPHVRPLAENLGASLILPLDVEQAGQMEAVFAEIAQGWGKLDFVIHAIAFATKDDLHGRVTDCSREGFARAMDISCHSFMRLAKLAEPLMSAGGCLLTMGFLGADKVVGNYGMMGPVKAALQSSARYMASELGPQGIRVNVISPGPLPTRASGGIKGFDALLGKAAARTPLNKTVDIDDIGALAAYLVSDGARAINGQIILADGGYSMVD
ncbi:enoyl-ACP reductase FabI [Uliginosibacterium gangwonense]|uniref:enoyl-ACP reductase FabI n=1 Tax=Uliginosibacterium gangwonense TaxID=392736 RepID=UPI00037B9C7C|nr:enoyl-ACP reductase FabI [Uliginosibacterium gangwonense]